MKEKIQKYWKWGAGLFLLAFLSLGLYVAHFELRAQVLEIYFFDLDRGRSIFIRTPHNQSILIDGGQNTQVIHELTKVLPFYRRRIDTIIITNSATKNSGGLGEVVRRYSIGRVIESGLMGTSTALTSFEKELSFKKIEPQKMTKGDSFEIDGVKCDILFPDPSFKYNKSSLPELVLSLSYGSTDILLLGDVSKTIQKSFIPFISRADLIEYAHGASDSKASGDLFGQLHPTFAVIKKQIRAPSTRVAKNPPKKPPFDIEKQEGVKVVNLETEGTIRFVSEGKEVFRK